MFLAYSWLLVLVLLVGTIQNDSSQDMKQKKAQIVKKHLKRLKKQDGAIKLIGGRGEFEGM